VRKPTENDATEHRVLLNLILTNKKKNENKKKRERLLQLREQIGFMTVNQEMTYSQAA